MANREEIQKRRNLIKEIIIESPKLTQKQILDKVLKKGYAASIATIKRDIKDLGFLLGDKGYEVDDKTKKETLHELDLKAVFAIDPPQIFSSDKNDVRIIYISTPKGFSTNFIAQKIDLLFKDRILGTITGNRLVLVLVRGEKRAKNILKELKRLLP